MVIRLKNFSGKLIKEKSLIFNCVLILVIFTFTQMLGILICFNFFSSSLIYSMGIMLVLNFILYKILTM
ncbi:hypothetical protein C4097_02255 [Clostridioides difficile]|nr:hypothetical protein KW95_12990 [Clostridioides difficile]KPI50854.1 hypothetical protein KW94_13175 [Clostridioides difficile]MDB3083379.1 hypothetical protein [Clostridioides difficile]CZR97799.1 hypothetical protein CDFC105_62592 [Clostridioides difficile]CZS01900.1 hypothetical protein CDFC105_70724 [Clostridioides difficile]